MEATSGEVVAVDVAAESEPTLARRIVFKSMGGLLALPLNLFLQLMVPRALGAAAYGDYSFLSAFFTSFLSFADGGSSQAFYNKVSQRPAEPSLYAFYARFSIAVLAVLGLVVALVYGLGVSAFVWPHVPAALVILAAAMAFGNWLISIAGRAVDANALTARGEATTVAVRLLLVLAVAAFFLTHTLTVRVFFAVQNVFNALLLVGLLAVLARLDRVRAFAARLDRNTTRHLLAEFWTYCHPLLVASFAVLLGDLADRWLLQQFAGSAQQGYLGLGLQIGSVVFIFGGAMATILGREFARSHHVQNHALLREQFMGFVPRAYALTAFFGVFFVVEAPAIVTIFGGKQFALAASTTAVLCLYPLHQVYGQMGNAMLYATHRTREARNIGVVGIALGIALTYVLIAPHRFGGFALGSLGIAVKMVAQQAIIVNVVLHANTRFLGTRTLPLLAKQVVTPVSLGACALVAELGVRQVVARPIAAFLLAGVVYCILVLVAARCLPTAFGLDRSDVKWMRERVRALIAARGQAVSGE